jgi:diguanylate cyclase (GGDEF)-like protein
MTKAAPPSDRAQSIIARVSAWLAQKWVYGITLAIPLVALGSLLWQQLRSNSNSSEIAGIIVAMTTLPIAWWGGVARRRHWSGPTRRLADLVQQARNGDATIEQLETVRGGIAPLVPIVQQLLRDLKQQRAETAAEIRQRVAGRTNALERRIDSLQLQAMRDPLTGLFNRRALEQELPRMIEQMGSAGNDLCLLMIDVDNFKPLNDTLGHAAGDQLLKEISQIIRSTVRDDDMAFRVGGDELVVLLGSCNFTGGKAIAERLDSLVVALTRPLQTPRQVRLSIGVCTLMELAEASPAGLMEVADKRLYAVKAARHEGDAKSRRAG